MGYDGPKPFLVPSSNAAARENLQRTVIEGVDADDVRAFTDRSFNADRVPVWGTKEGNTGTWKKLDVGDFLLFYASGTFTHAARVVGTEENEPFGRDLWPNHDRGNPWKYIIYLDDVVEIDAPWPEIRDLAGYSSSFNPMGFMPLNEMGIGGLRGKYGSVENYVYGQTPDDVDSDVDVAEPLDVAVPESVLSTLHFPDDRGGEILDQINSALNAGKHVILTGPPGTGKTEIARLVCEYLAEETPTVTGYEMTTATADWSTFETVGGYMPEENGDGDLQFEPGQVLRRFKRGGAQRNELLVVDEINRADIDKSFGQLFTLLSGQGVQLPYKRDGEEIEIVPGTNSPGPTAPHRYVMPNSWRLFATMNSYDKTSLYELSYAFMRRFAFVHVDAPDIPEGAERERVSAYADVWDIPAAPATLESVGYLWRAANGAVEDRKLGPAIIKDVLTHVEGSTATRRHALTQAVLNYVFPQLEGVPKRGRIVANIIESGEVDEGVLRRRAGEILGATVPE